MFPANPYMNPLRLFVGSGDSGHNLMAEQIAQTYQTAVITPDQFQTGTIMAPVSPYTKVILMKDVNIQKLGDLFTFIAISWEFTVCSIGHRAFILPRPLIIMTTDNADILSCNPKALRRVQLERFPTERTIEDVLYLEAGKV